MQFRFLLKKIMKVKVAKDAEAKMSRANAIMPVIPAGTRY